MTAGPNPVDGSQSNMSGLDTLKAKLAELRKPRGDGDKISGPKASGILVGQRSVHVYAGKLEEGLSGAASAKEYPVEDGKLGAALNQLLERGEIGRNVVIGLDPTLDFLSTARSDDGNQIQAQGQLADRLAGRLPGGVASRENKAGTNKIKLKSLLFFPRRIGLSVLEGLKSIGRNHVHLLSTTHVIHALACKRKASPRKWKVEIRVLVDEPESVALLCFGGVPVARQTVPTSGDAKVAALSSVIQRMAAAAQTELNLGDLSGVILHCDAADLPVVHPCCASLNVPVLQAPAIPMKRAALAAMLCNAPRRGRGAPLELASVLSIDGERPGFPLKQFIPAAAALVISSGYLYSTGSNVLAEVAAMEESIESLVVEREISRDGIVDLRDGMGIEVGVAEAFLVQRVYWGPLLLELMEATPEGCFLTEIEGRYPYKFEPTLVGDEGEEGEVKTFGAQSVRRLKLGAFLPSYDGYLGDERERIGAALEGSELISSAFPELTNGSISTQEENGEERFLFTIEARSPGGRGH
jgi:hypothetical protein